MVTERVENTGCVFFALRPADAGTFALVTSVHPAPSSTATFTLDRDFQFFCRIKPIAQRQRGTTHAIPAVSEDNAGLDLALWRQEEVGRLHKARLEARHR